MDETTQETKLRLIEQVQKLSDDLGYVPDRYDWVIYSEEKWQTYFPTWSAFLKTAGLIKSKFQRSRYDKEKLCKVLRVIERRSGKRVTQADWIRMVDDDNRNGVWSRDFSMRFEYWTGTPKVKQMYIEYTDDHEYLITNDDRSSWLNFRYCAGLDQYSAEDLINIGLVRLNIMEKSRKTLRKILQNKTAIAVALKDDKIRHEFSKGLPHFAIYDEFQSFKNYFEIVAERWVTTEPIEQNSEEVIAETNPQEAFVLAAEPKQDEDVKTLLSNLSETVLKLAEKGIVIEVTIRTNSPVNQEDSK